MGAPASVAPSVLATVLSVRIALIASSMRFCFSSRNFAAPRFPASASTLSEPIRADSKVASSREHMKEMPRANPT